MADRIVSHVIRVLQTGALRDAVLCEIVELRPFSVVLAVHGRLTEICKVVCDLRNGAIDNVPPANYVCVNQPTLEDILVKS